MKSIHVVLLIIAWWRHAGPKQIGLQQLANEFTAYYIRFTPLFAERRIDAFWSPYFAERPYSTNEPMWICHPWKQHWNLATRVDEDQFMVIIDAFAQGFGDEMGLALPPLLQQRPAWRTAAIWSDDEDDEPVEEKSM